MQSPRTDNNGPSECADLDRRYGAIGISAVAAALRYQSEAKNPAYAPVAAKPREETEEAAA